MLFLSSGEIGLAGKIAEAGARLAAGMESRIVALRADAGAGLGIFETLHGAPDLAAFTSAEVPAGSDGQVRRVADRFALTVRANSPRPSV